MSYSPSWRGLLHKRFHSEVESVAEAEECKCSETGSDSDSQPHPEDDVEHWWVEILHQLSKEHTVDTTLKVVSGCTGSSAEAFCLKAQGGIMAIGIV